MIFSKHLFKQINNEIIEKKMENRPPIFQSKVFIIRQYNYVTDTDHKYLHYLNKCKGDVAHSFCGSYHSFGI